MCDPLRLSDAKKRGQPFRELHAKQAMLSCDLRLRAEIERLPYTGRNCNLRSQVARALRFCVRPRSYGHPETHTPQICGVNLQENTHFAVFSGEHSLNSGCEIFTPQIWGAWVLRVSQELILNKQSTINSFATGCWRHGSSPNLVL